MNLIIVAEGDEERMSIGYRQFVRQHPELFTGADAMYRFGSQGFGGGGELSGGSEGCVYVELTTSGAKWGRGPTVSDIHGGNKRSVDSPAWRHIQMLKTLVSEDGNKVLIDGFYDNIEPLTQDELAKLEAAAKGVDMKVAAENLGVARFISDDPLTYLKMARYGTSMNLDGIWGGNMYAGGAGAILPNKITSKHNFRYLPKMDGIDITKKLRAHLDKHGFQDVEMKVIGDVPWAKMRYDTDGRQGADDDLRRVRHPVRHTARHRVDPRRLLAGVSLHRRRAEHPDCRRRSRLRRQRARGQRVLRHRRRGQGLRHRRRGEVGRHLPLQLRRQERPGPPVSTN